jgi:hypothetical protein
MTCQKDPLRALSDDERIWLLRVARSQAEPAAHVARAKALLAVADGRSYTDAAGAADAALTKLSLIWSHASTGRGLPPLNLAMAVVLRSSTRTPSASASWPRCAGLRSAIETALRVGRLRRCAGLYGRPPTGCPSEHPYHLEDLERGGLRLAEGS